MLGNSDHGRNTILYVYIFCWSILKTFINYWMQNNLSCEVKWRTFFICKTVDIFYMSKQIIIFSN